MAREVVTITDLVTNEGVAAGAGTTIVVANGAIIDVEGNLEGLFIMVTNTHGATKVVTIPKGVGRQSVTASLGDITYTIGATTGRAFFSLEGARVLQEDGTVHVNFATDHAGVIQAYRIPRGG
jgi:hypothetical protein